MLVLLLGSYFLIAFCHPQSNLLSSSFQAFASSPSLTISNFDRPPSPSFLCTFSLCCSSLLGEYLVPILSLSLSLSLSLFLNLFFSIPLLSHIALNSDISNNCPSTDICSEGTDWADCVQPVNKHAFLLFYLWIGFVALVWCGHFFYYYIAPFIVKRTRMCFGWRRVRNVDIQPKEGMWMGKRPAEDVYLIISLIFPARSGRSSDPRKTFGMSRANSRSGSSSEIKRSRRTDRMRADRSSMIGHLYGADTTIREVVFQYRPLAKK